ncbi:AAA family ATPase [Epibacterium sp. MM17-32]|uniref:AAA family ATPase n=1 Tax=Epibacterium sp. MM17-32 TaxID=2917734 RepID=UPI001EF61F27|nr:AAA family ATPase [Epibacterium sp. MM17-32]MCG7628965.1 AAA family ATPase [Epibacterium sp. MM17-32]
MIKRLYIDQMFRHFDRTFTFENGLTGIIGPNESGKSLIVEAIRYALFGSKALRGKSEDYKKLHVELDFSVGGVDYTVVRKGAKVTLQGGDHQASGTKPVDEAIRGILGYDMHVFDVANACNQGNIEALSDMTPTARKAMVDKTVGLTALDDLIKLASQEGNALKREAEAMERGLVEPVQPEQPEFYLPSASVEPRLNEARRDLTEFNQLAGFLSRAPSEPVPPVTTTVEETAEQLQAYQEERTNLERSIHNLQIKLANIEPEAHSAADLDEFEAWMDQADRWTQKERLLAQGHICCPECSHEWPVADLGDLADVEEVRPPSMTRRELGQHRARLGNNDLIKSTEQNIAAIEQTLADMPDRSTDLLARQRWEAAEQTYQHQLAAWSEYNSGLAEKKARFEELKGIDETVATLQSELQQAQQFEKDFARYESDLEVYTEKAAEVSSLREKSAEYLKAREIIQALKVSVKTHLLPSLNKVASVLLSQMTGGERYLVEVDEDFEITIDGQRIGTLSGSGKAVANLAIRIALGQILTNRVFSVFMADEVDAAMDDDRAAYTAEALRRLTDHVGQVILVTHKRPETDHTFELKK